MNECELEKVAFDKRYSRMGTSRVPLAPAESNNGTTRPSRIREVSSRYRSPSPSVPSSVRRCPSPNTARTLSTPVVSVQKRATSAERKRPTLPSPSTPVQDTGVETLKKLAGNKLPENLWPSTMRSLSVSFQSDAYSLSVNKKEKPAPQTVSDRSLRSYANIAHKQGDLSSGMRKPTPERKRSPLRGNNLVDQSENSRPVDGVNGRLVEQYRSLSKAGGKLSSTPCVDLSDKTSKISSAPRLWVGMPSVRRLSVDSASKPSPKTDSDSLLGGHGRRSLEEIAVEKPSVVRIQSFSSSGSRHPSPNKAFVLSSSLSRGVSPSRTKPISSSPVRTSSPSRQSNSPSSVLSFIVDIRKGKKDVNHIEDAHQLRLLYNRHLQWRFANARANALLQSQKVKAEITLYVVWRAISEMWDLLIAKRIELQKFQLALKLYSIMGEQLTFLDRWALVESDHASSISIATEDLRSCTLRVPINGSTRGDIESVKSAVCSTVDIMQTMDSSICLLISPVEGINCLISELGNVAAQQRAMFDECKALLASVSALQVEEHSIRTNLIQLRQSMQLS